MAQCEGCGNQAAYALHIRFGKDGKEESCNVCGNVSAGGVGIPDVYWPGHPHKDGNIVDKMGNEILIESRQHKAQLLRERGMREANDRYHGGPGHRRR